MERVEKGAGSQEPAIKGRSEKAEQGLCFMVRNWIPYQVLSDFQKSTPEAMVRALNPTSSVKISRYLT